MSSTPTQSHSPSILIDRDVALAAMKSFMRGEQIWYVDARLEEQWTKEAHERFTTEASLMWWRRLYKRGHLLTIRALRREYVANAMRKWHARIKFVPAPDDGNGWYFGRVPSPIYQYGGGMTSIRDVITADPMVGGLRDGELGVFYRHRNQPKEPQ